MRLILNGKKKDNERILTILNRLLKNMDMQSKIYLAGHMGMVGSAIKRKMELEGYKNLVFRTHKELDLINQQDVEKFFIEEKPEYVFFAAGKVGGILGNKLHKADFIYENIQMTTNIIHNAWKYGVKKLLFLGSSCIYPKLCPQPIKEEYFLSGILEETNDAYAVSKIAGIKMCQSYYEQYRSNFISLMSTNLYGPHDSFGLKDSHVLPAMIRKFYEAKINNRSTIVLWGTGSAYREFLYVDDFAEAAIFLMNHYNDPTIINVGTGVDISIKQLSETIKKIVNYQGEIIWDMIKPDGTPKKQLDVTKITQLGWSPKTTLEEGLERTYKWFVENYERIRQ